MRPSAGIAKRAVIPRDPETRNRIDPEGAETNKRVYVTSSTFEPTYEIEWIRSDFGDIEISKIVSGIVDGKSTVSRNNLRRCHRTSISSGYSSHSPPLSAGSYSYYASTSTRNPLYGGLTVIHESEAIPRPIWPSIIYHRAEDYNGIYEDIYTCRMCGCTFSYSSPLRSSPPPPSPLTTTTTVTTSSSSRARQVLLELSRTLNSVIDGDVTTEPEDILRDISHIVSLETGTKNDDVYEYVSSSWTFDDKNPSIQSNYTKNMPSRLNLNNLKFSPRYLYGYNSKCSVLSLSNNKMMRREDDNETKRSYGLARKKPCESESKYSTLKCSDGSSETIVSSSANGWDHRLTIRGDDIDFTLDIAQAERLSRMIAKAKRKRQWCRVLTTFFGLVFFVLSVVVVSLSVTRGRKVFGSM